MSTLVDYYSTGDDNYEMIYGATWRAQTFTASKNYNIGSVKLKLYKSGSPGDFDIKITTTSSGQPTTTVLTSATYNGNSLGSSPGAFVEIPLTPYSLTSGTKYAIVVSNADMSSESNSVYWRMDASSPSYSGGSYATTSNSGSSWLVDTSADYMFQTYEQDSGPANLETANGLAKASVKTRNGLALASIKTWNGLA